MPELPEVETIKRGLITPCVGQTIQKVRLHRRDLRWPVPMNLPTTLTGQRIVGLTRRSKYLLFQCEHHTMLIHLGMSGYLRMASLDEPYQKHDHAAFLFQHHQLIFNDTRRFGAILLTDKPINEHRLLQRLGPEPLSPAFNADYLYEQIRRRQAAIKTVIMNAHIVVGIGNIYANEALFSAHIHPFCPAKQLCHEQSQMLVNAINVVIDQAISLGGTTLKDFKNANGKPGYFQQALQVYAKETQPCSRCQTPIKRVKLSGRSTFYCPQCQGA